jgi:hypothetical protein
MDIPVFITASVLAVAGVAVVSVAVVLNRHSALSGAGPRVGTLVGAGLAAWLVLTAALASVGAYRPASAEAIPPVGAVLIAGLVGLALAVTASPRLRRTLASPAMQASLLGLQVWRIEGAVFLILLGLGQLPALFAAPAGVGDLLIGITAPWMARNVFARGSGSSAAGRRGLAVAWNLFGLADLALAVFLGTTTNPGRLWLFVTAPTSEAMAGFPMAIIPTFLVPLSIGLHLVSLRYLVSRRPWSAAVPAVAHS